MRFLSWYGTVGAVFFFIAIFACGYWLSRSGKPYNGAIFNAHKLIALAAVALFVVLLYRAYRTGTLSPVELIAGTITVLFFLGLFATGTMLSIAKPMPAIVTRAHHVTPYLAVLSSAVTLYFLSGRT